MAQNTIQYADAARAFACLSVVLAHASAPYAASYGNDFLTHAEWLAAHAIHSCNRWGVPAFMLLSGFLLIREEYDVRHYLKRRLLRVIVPFAIWSLFYCAVNATSGLYLLENVRFDPARFVELVTSLPASPAHYHLSFFYYFIPVCAILPFLHPFARCLGAERMWYFFAFTAGITMLPLLFRDRDLFPDLFVYTLYAVVGFGLRRTLFFGKEKAFAPVLLLCFGAAFFGTWYMNHLAGGYDKLFYGFKVLPTFLAAVSVVALSRLLCDREVPFIAWISRYSLGIFILHPFFLRFVNTFQVHVARLDPVPCILFRFVFASTLSFLAAWLFSRSRATRWMLP